MSLSFKGFSTIHSFFITLFVLLSSTKLSTAIPVTTDLVTRGRTPPTSGYNDYSCRSPSHPNPVMLIHGLLANQYDDLGPLAAYLKANNFCTFGLTYGYYSLFPLVGGLKAVDGSSIQITSFIQDVIRRTGAKQVDLVGHSEGAFMTLYIPKVRGLASQVRKIVAVAPPTHGSTLDNLYDLTSSGGGSISSSLVQAALDFVGCDACDDLVPDGGPVETLTTGTVVQSGNTALIIASQNDEIVTPPSTAFVNPSTEVAQGGSVTNVYIQDECPNDHVGHAGLAYDPWVWERTANWLDPSIQRTGRCYQGLPVKH